ncbi:CvpA family protein [Suttonella sp. R2A3]|uniref:CvpA family protein n=1 Tax=Suttonella sp. R2A3 TaxID=2908648 RepID=UPI001F3F6CC6|nr:CvpA family protein [Suttonella sp. R2A3]UJF24730.1 CvpA family protein [Suttonella sp. R2A3]
METLNYLDAALGAIVIISALVGLARGLLKEVLSLVAWAAAAYIAFLFAEMIAEKYIVKFINDPLISYLAAFGLLFLCTLFAIGLINLIITQLLSRTGMGGFDRFLGMLFGLARGAIIGALAVFVLGLTPAVNQSWWQTSVLQPGFSSLADWGRQKLPDEVRSLLGRYTGEEGDLPGQAVLQLERNAIINAEGEQATRPETMVEGEARNAISEMSENEPAIQLESYDPEQNNVTAVPQPTAPAEPAVQNAVHQSPQTNSESSASSSANEPSIETPEPPALILESIQ